MTSSLDWAGFVSAATATAQAAAVMVQVYWDRSQRGTGTAEREGCPRKPHHGKAFLPDTRVVRVKVSVKTTARMSVTLVVLEDGGAGGAGSSSLPARGFRLW
ncbi:hypothetical protein [Streptomyces sp. NPDC006335]|uniref:hypothetical protein n=1 Tax=Streptomyces sp. NPDC006335 TaxID=3156895 RepID=UPI0033AB7CAC